MNKRIFTSIDLTHKIKQDISSLQNKGIYWIKWSPPENFHITLNFLGDLNDDEIAVVKQVMAEVCGAFGPFRLDLSSLRGQQDMLWLVAGQSDGLDKLQWLLRTEFKKAGVGKTERRGYVPHVLIAKSKTGRHMSHIPEKFSPIELPVDRINLYESKLTPGAATHILIQSYPLGTANED